MTLSIEDLLNHPNKVEELDFEAGLEVLNSINDALSKRELKLADLVKLYEIGTNLSKKLFNFLKQAEDQIETLRKMNDQLVEEIRDFGGLIEQVKGSTAR